MSKSNLFKVVSTKEKRGIYFSVVPHKWEAEGILYWPQNLKYSDRETLRSDPDSIPDRDTWDQFPCIVKLCNIPSFKDGLEFEKKLTECIDSDAEEVIFMNLSKKKQITQQSMKPEVSVMDRNNLFSEEILQVADDTRQQFVPTVITYSNTVIDDNNITILGNASEINNTNIGASADVLEALHSLKEEILNVKSVEHELKNEVLAIKEEVKKQYTKININLDKIYKLISQNDVHKIDGVVSQNKVPAEDLVEKFRFPLGSCEEISKLDKEIRNNSEFKSQLVATLSKIGGKSGKEDGVKLSYKIIDFLFRADVLIHYSWTGICRSKNSGEKLSFQLLEGIIETVFEVVLMADNRHTKQKNANIFKEGVLKHAKKRSQRKRGKLQGDRVNVEAVINIDVEENINIDVEENINIDVEENVNIDVEENIDREQDKVEENEIN